MLDWADTRAQSDFWRVALEGLEAEVQLVSGASTRRPIGQLTPVE